MADQQKEHQSTSVRDPVRSRSRVSKDWLVEGGELGRIIRGTDWSATALGPRHRWPQSLRTVVSLVVENEFPMLLLWGPELLGLYNDACRTMFADRHPDALGRPMCDAWPELWPHCGRIVSAVLSSGKAVFSQDVRLRVRRHGRLEDATFTLSESPVRVEDGSIGGVLVTLQETSAEVERDRLLREIELAPDGYFLSDAEGRYVEVNDAGCRMLKCTRAEVLGRTAWDFMTAADQARLRELHETPQPTGIRRFELTLRRPDGSELPIDVHTRLLPNGLRQSIARDISERKAQEHERQLELEAMERLHQVSTLFLHGQDSEALLGTILEAAIAISGADFGNIRAVMPRTGELKMVAQRNFPDWWLEFWEHAGAGHGSSARALAQRTQIIVEDVTKSELFTGAALEVQLRAGVRAVQSTPLISRTGAALGVISTHYKTPQRPSDRSLRLLEMLARQVADILERARTESELRRAEAKASGILAISADAIISVDDRQHITEWNSGAEKMFGYAREEALGAPLDLLIPARYHAAHRGHVARFAAEASGARKMDQQGAVGVRKNGEEFPIDATISRLLVGRERILTVAVRDSSEQRRHEREQRVLVELGDTLASLPYDDALKSVAAITVRALADFVIVYIAEEQGTALRRVAAASGAPGQEWIAELLMDQRPSPPPAHPIWTALREARTQLVEVRPEHYEALAQSPQHLAVLREGAPRWFLTVPLQVGGQCVGGLCLASLGRRFEARDQQLAEEVARRCALFLENARLHRAEKQAAQARDDVLGIVAHDLRSPLNAISLQLQLLLRQKSAQEGRWQTPVERIRNSVLRMNRLIQDLLDVARLESGALSIELRSLSPREVLGEVMDGQRPLATAGSIELVLEVTEPLPPIRGDGSRLFQVFDNLIGNALKFTPAGGRITIGAFAQEREVVFRVSDTGAGISAENLSHLFDRFWQAQRSDRRGIGLGLSIVRGIVAAHGGRLWVDSELGRGTSFFFAIPTAPAVAS
ncbi:MAG: PAS domain S-box protein [Polyangia bacterium]